MLPNRWLAILDDGHSSEDLRGFLETRGHAVRCFSQGDRLVAAVRSETLPAPAVVLLDVSIPGVDGLARLRSLRELQPGCQIVLVSNDGRASTIVEALRLGAVDYVVKSEEALGEPRLETVVREALERSPFVAKARELRDGPPRDVDQTWRQSGGPMREIAWLIERVADCDAIVLIQGESGVGKELVARAIHRQSSRARAPLVKVNCAALPADLLESELFGHERGAFTGADAPRAGKFEEADHGTILLDEIGELSLHLQAKLLHVLEGGSFTRLGSNRPVVVDARVLAATNRDLSAMKADGTFREDLYYRLKVIEIPVPPLRERRQELAFLITHFLERFSAKYNRPIPPISDDLRQLLFEYSWPGNVRELENCMKRLALLQDPDQVMRDLRSPRRAPAEAARGGLERQPARVIDNPQPTDAADPVEALAGVKSLPAVSRQAVERAEREAIERALSMVRGNKRRAAECLGVSYKTVLNKIRDLAIELPLEAAGARG